MVTQSKVFCIQMSFLKPELTKLNWFLLGYFNMVTSTRALNGGKSRGHTKLVLQEQLVKVFNDKDRFIKIKVPLSPLTTGNRRQFCKPFWPGNWEAQEI